MVSRRHSNRRIVRKQKKTKRKGRPSLHRKALRKKNTRRKRNYSRKNGRFIRKRGGSNRFTKCFSNLLGSKSKDVVDDPEAEGTSGSQPAAPARVPCDVHASASLGTPGYPYQFSISQEDAHDYYTAGVKLGEGGSGETRISEASLNGQMVKIVVKKFREENATGECRREVMAHLEVWKTLSSPPYSNCLDYFAVPACMTTYGPSGPNDQKESYSVQSLIHKPGYNDVLTARNCSSVKAAWLRSLPQPEKEKICKKYGSLLACIAKSGYIHGDLKEQNLLVLIKNDAEPEPGPEAEGEPESGAEPEAEDEVEFRVIDWGSSKKLQQDRRLDARKSQSVAIYFPSLTEQLPDVNRLGYIIKDELGRDLYPVTEPTHTGFDCIARAMFGIGVAKIGGQNQLYSDKDIGVTYTNVYEWVLDGYATALGLEIPSEIEEAFTDAKS